MLAIAMAVGLGFVATAGRKGEKPVDQTTATPTIKLAARESKKPRVGKAQMLIKEWDVELRVPSDLQSKVSYQFAGPFTDQQRVQIEQVKLLVLNQDETDNACEIVYVDGRQYIFSATQLLRTPAGSPIDPMHYQGELRANIFKNRTHSFHANYLVPDCAGPDTTQLIKRLQLRLSLQAA